MRRYQQESESGTLANGNLDANELPRTFRRVIIGNDERGRSCVESDERVNPQLVFTPNHVLCDVWATNLTDFDQIGATFSVDGRFRLPDRPGDVIAKMVVWPPQEHLDRFLERNPTGLSSVAGDLSLTDTETDIPNVVMHEVPSIDITWILSGEITCILENGEATLRAGDLLMQRATNHGWTNRGTEPCVMACASISSKPLTAREWENV